MSIKIVAILAVKPAHRAELLAVFRDLVAKSRAEAGNQRVEILPNLLGSLAFYRVG